MRKYILGLFTGLVAIPILDSLLELLYSWVEVAKIKPASIVMEWNKTAGGEDEQSESTYAIGFQIPTESSDDEECEEI